LTARELNNPVKYKITLAAIVFIFLTLGLSLFNSCSPSVTVSESKAAIIDQLYTLQANPAFIEQTTGILTGYGYKVDNYRGDEVTVDLLRRLPELGYRLIIFRAHAGLLGSGGKAIPKTCIFTNESYSETRHVTEQLSGKLAKARINEESPWVFAIGADFVSSSMQGKFNRTFIITMGCSTLYIPDLAKAFIDKGAVAYIGWDASVDLGYVDNATLVLLKELGADKASIKGALAATMKAVGPDPYWHAELQHYPVSETLKVDIRP
jgi:hypothetical protein